MRTRIATALVTALVWVAGCNVGGTGGQNPGGPDAGLVADVDVEGTITSSVVWGGTVRMLAETIVAPGVVVTIAPGTRFESAQGAILRVEGTLVVAGTEAEPIALVPMDGAPAWAGIAVESGAGATIRHAVSSGAGTFLWCKAGASTCAIEDTQLSRLGKAIDVASVATVVRSDFRDLSNGGVTVKPGGDLTITDTYIWTSSHDLVVTSGGTLTMDYSEVGGAQLSYEHCDVHIGAADSVRVTNSNIVSAIYGVMIGNTNGAVFNNNNFIDNDPAQDISPVGPNTGVDLTGNYWSNGAPAGLGGEYDVSGALSAPIEGIGPRR